MCLSIVEIPQNKIPLWRKIIGYPCYKVASETNKAIFFHFNYKRGLNIDKNTKPIRTSVGYPPPAYRLGFHVIADRKDAIRWALCEDRVIRGRIWGVTAIGKDGFYKTIVGRYLYLYRMRDTRKDHREK